MTVFNTYFKVAKKHIKSLILYTIIFLGIILMLTLNESKDVDTYQTQAIDVSVINYENTDLANGLYNYIDSIHNIIAIEDDIDVIRDELFHRNVEYVLIIPEGFTESFLSGNTEVTLHSYKLPGSITGKFLDNNIDNFLSVFGTYLKNGMNRNDAYENSIKTLSVTADVAIYDDNVEERPESYRYFHYLSYILICVIIEGIVPILMAFNQIEMKKRTLCSTISVFRRNISLALGSGILVFGMVAIYMVIALILCPDLVLDRYGLIRIASATLYAFLCLALAFLISAIVKKADTSSMFSNVLGLSSSFLCGVFIPREYLTAGVINSSRFFPAYWYVNILEETFVSNVSMEKIAGNMLILGLYIGVFMIVAMVITSKKAK